jgi:phosphoglycerol transferase
VRLAPALACGVLYALLPFHQFRLYGHTHLGIIYFGAPLAIVPAIEILRGSNVVLAGWRLVRDRTTLGLLAISVFTGLWGYVYFTFFAVITIVAAGLVRAVRTRALEPNARITWLVPLLRAGAFTAVTALSFVVQNAGILAYLRANGRATIGLRAPAESEMFALKLVQLVLPMSGHRVEAFRNLRRAYDTSAPLVNENGSAYLGLIGAAGFLVLLVVVARGPRADAEGATGATRSPIDDVLSSIAVTNLVAFLLGTMGGLGALIAYLGFDDVRSYNRISVFVGFYALFAVAILVDRALERARARATQIAATAAVAIATVLGVYDQTFEGTPDYAAFARQFDADTAFIRRVEAALPEGAQVFQMPYMMFPEGGPKVGLADYAHLAPYLHTTRLRWSYGAMRGRIGDERYKELASAPLPALADGITIAGYAALWVDPRGFEEGDRKALEADLRARLGEPIASDPRGILVWSLAENEKKLRAELGADFDKQAREQRERPFLGFNDGFYLKETTATSFWYAAKPSAKLFVVNPSDHVQRLAFDTYYRTASPVAPRTKLRIDGDLLHEELDIDPDNHRLVKTIDVPPGTHLIHFRTDAIWAPIEVDPRKRVLILQQPLLRAP